MPRMRASGCVCDWKPCRAIQRLLARQGSEEPPQRARLGRLCYAGKRGSGVGKWMMKMLLERGGTLQGIQQILLCVTTTQTAAVGLYRSLGFASFGREPRALKVGERFIDEEYMVLWIA